jgi:hypothetical protein
MTVTAQPQLVILNNATPPTPLGSTGLQLTATRNINGSISPNPACATANLETNGGNLSVTVANGSFSTAGVAMSISLAGGSGSSQTATLTTAPTTLQVCGTQNSASVLTGPATGNVTITDAFNNKTTLPVTLTISSSIAGQLAVFHQSNTGNGGAGAVFAIDANGNFQFDPTSDKFKFFGLNGDIPVAGDWDGTGVVRVGVFRQGVWILDLNNNGVYDGTGSGKDGVFFFGLPGDIPVVGDWNGDGRGKFGVFRCGSSTPGSTCAFILDYAGKMAFDPTTAKVFNYGLAGDKPVVGRWNANSGVDQIGVYRCPTSGSGGCAWIVNTTGSGSYSPSDSVYFYGLPGDMPIVGDWFGQGTRRIGVFRNGVIVLNISGSGSYGPTDFVGSFGLPGDYPVIGTWTGGLIQ